MGHLQFIDYLVILGYFAGIALVGLRMARRQKTTLDYFIAGRRIPAWAVAFTMMATMISSVTFVAHPAATFQKNYWLQVGSFGAPLVLLIVVFVAVPFYRRVLRMSTYEYLEQRFGLVPRLYASFGFIVLRMLDLGFTLFTTAIAVEVMTGWPIVYVITGIALFTMIYTMFGGIEGVIWTDVVQGFILLGGALLIVLLLLFMPSEGPAAVLKTAWDGGKFSFGNFEWGWETLFYAEPTAWILLFSGSMAYARSYLTEQNMVQRYLIARTDREAQRGVSVGVLSCIPIWFGFAFIGACLWSYYQLSGNALPDAIRNQPDNILPYFVATELPRGVVGLILAAILAAAQSTISADLNSVSTVVTTDYFVRWKPAVGERARLFVGRLSVAIGGMTCAGVALSLTFTRAEAAMATGATLVSIIGGGILGLFALAYLTQRSNCAGAVCGIVACFIFMAWATLTGPMGFSLGLPASLRYAMHPILIGVFSHVILFGVGYVASFCFAAPQPEGSLTIWNLVANRQP